MAVYLTVSETHRQKWTGGSFYPPLAGIRVNGDISRIKYSYVLLLKVVEIELGDLVW